MKILIISGDDKQKAYERLNEILAKAKKKSWQIVRIRADGPFSLSETLSSASLFGKNRLFVLEDPLKFKASEFSWLKKQAEKIEGTLIILLEGTASSDFLKKLPKQVKIEQYKLPKIIFNLLDSFYPGNESQIIKTLHEAAKRYAPEFILTLLAGRLKEIYWLKTDPESLSFPSWRMGKLKKQAEYFSVAKLARLIDLLAEQDVKAKTSGVNIIDLLDFVILSELE